MYFSDSGIMLWGTVFMVWDILHLSDYLAIHRIDIHDCFLMNILIMGFYISYFPVLRYARLMKD
jgi:hypothetical protein